jgi:hypothetical protein
VQPQYGLPTGCMAAEEERSVDLPITQRIRWAAMNACSAVVAVVLVLAIVDSASAQQAPVLHSVGHDDRHPTAQFGPLPGVDDATISIATKPDRATDGRFLTENLTTVDSLTDQEIQFGSWLHEDRLDPGTYYVMMRTADFQCSENPNCIQGYSNMLSLAVPKPTQRFSGRVRVFRFLGLATLTLRINPLGEDQPYRVCWRLKTKRRICLRGTVDGYSWGSDAADSLDARTRGMARRTKFTWSIGSRRVASRTVTVPGR